MAPRSRSSRLRLVLLRGRLRAPVGALTTIVYLATLAPPQAARAASVEESQPAETPNFAESTNGVHGGADTAAATTTATKSRKAPVSAKGSFTRSVDIQVPPGRLGMTPSLALHYDSGSVAESAVGVGWSFGPPMISRSTRMGFPKVHGPDNARTYDDAAAIFSGPTGELVPATDGPSGTTGVVYAPAREASAVRYEYLAALGGYFIEHDPSGRKRFYGTDPCFGRIGRIVNELGTHAWLLLREEDAHGNSIAYRYHNDAEATRANKKLAQRTPVLGSVEWGSNGCVPIESAPFSVTTAIVSQAGPSNLLEGNTLLDHRISRIDVKIDGVIQWTYTLGYTTSETGKSLLTSVQRAGDASETTTFTYSRGAPVNGPRFVDMGALASPGPIYTNSSRWWQSLNPFEPQRPTAEQAIQAPGFRSGTKFIDVDGNGTTDAIYHAAGIGTTATHMLWEESALQTPAPTGLGAWILPALGPASQPSAQPDTGLPYFPLNGSWNQSDFASATVQELVDLDGDGDSDAIALSTNTEIVPGRYVSLGLAPPGPHSDPVPNGQMRVRITTNRARSAGVQHPSTQLIGNWPPGVAIASSVFATSGPFPTSPLQYKVEPQSDVQLPIVDINADGRPDLLLLKHRERRTNWEPGYAFAVPHLAMMRLYGGMQQQELGGVDDASVEEEVRRLVTNEHSLVIVDENLLLGDRPPGRHVHLQTTAGRLGIPELPGPTTMHVLSAPGGVPAPGFPTTGPLPSWGPGGPDFVPPRPGGRRPWWTPVVDPEGDVFLPLRDSYRIGSGGSGEIFLQGEYRFVPRTYLMRGDETRALIPEPVENASDFERSLQGLLNKGSASECTTLKCTYLPHVNFNTFFTDVNGDGLPDLISAEPPRVWSDGAGAKTTCLDGHRVNLNRGYAFETASNETIEQTWATSSNPTSALRRVTNRDRWCAATRPRIDDSSQFVNPFQTSSRPDFPVAAMAQTDINGDGRVDLVFAFRLHFGDPNVAQAVYLNTGRGFALAPGIALPPGVAIADNAPFPNQVAASLQGWPQTAMPDRARFVDLDNDGLVDIVKAGLCIRVNVANTSCTPAKWYRNAGTLPDRLERVDSASGAWTTIAYDSPKSAIVQIPMGGVHPPAMLRVVKTVRSAAGPVPTPAGYDPFSVQEIRLSYENFVRDSLSNEILGFEKVTSEFVNAFAGVEREHVRVTRVFDVRPEILDASGVALPVRHPLKGAPVSAITESDGWVAAELYEYLAERLGNGVRVRPRRELRGDVSPAQIAAWTGQETTQFDPFGNPIERVSGNYDGVGIAPAVQRRTTVTEYENRTGTAWQIGLVTRRQQKGYREDISGTVDPAHVLSDVVTTYDSKGSVASTARMNIRDASCAGPSDDVTTFDYWPHGLIKASHEAAGPGGTFTRDVSFTYEVRNLYVATAQTSVGRMNGLTFMPATTSLTVTFQTDLRHGGTMRTIDPNNAATASAYDSRGRLLTRTGPDNTVLQKNVYVDGFPLSETSTITSDIGKTFERRMQLDADGHALSVVEGAGTAAVPWSRKSKSRFDAFGRAVESFLPALVPAIGGGVTPATGPKDVTRYDGFDRPIQTTKADGTITSAAYEPREAIETNARLIVTRRGFDAFGDLTSVRRNPGGGADETSAHTFVRDGRGEIVKVTDGDGSIRRLERDGGGRIRYVTLPNRPAATPARFAMCHDLGDKLVHLETPAGRVVDLLDDELGRTLVSTATDANGLVIESAQVYDQGVPGGLGRLTRKNDSSGSYKFEYDLYGRPSLLSFGPSARAVAGATNVSTYSATFVYSPAGSLMSVTFSGLPGATTPALTYVRDLKGRPTMVNAGQGAAVTSLATGVTFDASDRVTSARYGNGTSGEWTFNPLTERLDRITYRTAANAVLAAVAYVYDPNDNLLEENREREGYAGIYSRKLHTYDALDRLRTSDTSSPAGNHSERYAFSAAGNLLSAGTDAYTYGSPMTTQATSLMTDSGAQTVRALAYDADGYLATDQETRGDGSSSTRSLAFDPTGCMHSITRADRSAATTTSAVSDYTCGLDGRVVARSTTRADGTRSRRIDFAGLAEIRPDEGVFLLRVPLHGSMSVEDARSLTTGARLTALSGYIVSDTRGSVLATTGFDSVAPGVTREAEYDAWGKKLTDYSSMAAPRRGFSGAEPDEAVGTYSFGARTYDPTLRRWVSPDPLLASLPSIDESVGESLNLYSYADGNPVKNTDKTGFCPVCIGVIAGGITILTMGASAPSDSKAAPPDLGGMLAAIPGPSVALQGAGALAKTAIAIAEKNAPGLVPIIRAAVYGVEKAAPAAAPVEAAVGSEATAVAKTAATKAETLKANAAAGAGWENTVAAGARETQKDVVTQLTVKTESGVKTRIDVAGKDPATGAPKLTEAKASDTAPLTKAQRAAFPEIAKTGCTVCGKGKPGWEGGTKIPPTTVEIKRP